MAGITAHEALRRGTFAAAVEAWADGGRLTELAALVGTGLPSPRLPPAEVARAHELPAAGGVRGRLVLVPWQAFIRASQCLPIGSITWPP
ncbi:hypothetical protein [Actinoplanes sp. NPDC049599]|uniref:hypothetical protein n=1 Tax=Actinoplanes sp. NPDC049599 TaxID=3363903 RepID=UPI0037B790DD